jgi:hypothetical protein
LTRVSRQSANHGTRLEDDLGLVLIGGLLMRRPTARPPLERILSEMNTRVGRSTSSALGADGNVLDHFGGWAAPFVDIANTDSGEA